ncbi:MAG: hypothetical protein ACRDYC_12920 [Acidimicrobiales bacterium]
MRLSAPSRRGEGGSALVLVPVGFLVLILLGAMAVDSGVAYLAQRQLSNALTAAANDASAAALSASSFYEGGQVVVDASRAEQVVCEDMAAQGVNDLHDEALQMAVAGDEVRLRGTAVVDAVFGAVVPGFSNRQVSAEVTGVVTPGPVATAPAPSNFQPISC